MKKLVLYILAAIIYMFAIPTYAQTAPVSGAFQITVVDNSCTTTAPCTLQLYRGAGVVAPALCPSLATNGAYTLVTLTASALTTTPTTTSTTWVYNDVMTNVSPGATFCYNATVTYTVGGGPSGSLGGLLATVPFPVPYQPVSLSATWIP
jgi:hypothetical protein